MTENNNTMEYGLADFPDEILLNIGIKLNVPSKRNFGHTCKYLFNLVADKDISPLNQRHSLYPHQEEAVEWFKMREAENKGGILVIPVGLGKTLSTLYFIAENRKRTLVIAPISLLKQWAGEIEKFFGEKNPIKYYIYHPTADKKYRGSDLTRYDIVITAKTIMARNDLELRLMRPQRIIVDEIHKVNTGTTYFESMKNINCHKFGLTATAYTRKETNLSSSILIQLDATNADRDGFKIIRREETDCTQNKVIEHNDPMNMDVKHAYTRWYDDFKRQLYLRNFNYSYSIFENIMQLKWAPYNHYNRGPDGRVTSVTTDYPENRMATLLELLKKYESMDKKCLVFFRGSVPEYIKTYLDDNGMGHCCFTGVSRERIKALKQFSETHNTLLTTFQHAAEGLNVQFASVIIFYNMPPSQRDKIQSIGRCNRIGQKNEIHVHTLYYKNSLEENFIRDPRLLGSSMEGLAMDFYYRENLHMINDQHVFTD
nr:putative ATP-dependent helicase [Kaumoebavirus]